MATWDRVVWAHFYLQRAAFRLLGDLHLIRGEDGSAVWHIRLFDPEEKRRNVRP